MTTPNNRKLVSYSNLLPNRHNAQLAASAPQNAVQIRHYLSFLRVSPRVTGIRNANFGLQFLISNVVRSQISEGFRIRKGCTMLLAKIPEFRTCLREGERNDERCHTFFFSFRYLPGKKRGKKTKAKTILNTLHLNMYIKRI